MSDYHQPKDQKDIEAAVQWAIAGGKSLEIVGQGSKRLFGRPVQCDATIDLSGMAGIILYEPQELVLSARAGTPIADIAALLAAKGQELAFEPMDYGPVLGGSAPAPRAITFLVRLPSRAGAKPSGRAAGWSRT
jgi:glycolate oxidase FAD binding subunit